MSNKLDRSQDFKRAIDLGLLGRLEPNDLIKVWDASAGAERAVSALTLLTGGIDIGVPTFLTLTDTPSTYSGQGGKFVAVKGDATGLEFVDGGSVGAGAGLSIDGDGDIQLGYKPFIGNRWVNINDWEEEEDGDIYGVFRIFYNSEFDELLNFRIGERTINSFISLDGLTTGVTIASSSLDFDRSGAGGVNRQRLLFDNTAMTVTDNRFEKGLEEAADYSANKTDNSYITPNWLKAQTGYNASVAQYFTHDSSGNFLWVDI
jgi:hypothetical protein